MDLSFMFCANMTYGLQKHDPVVPAQGRSYLSDYGS